MEMSMREKQPLGMHGFEKLQEPFPPHQLVKQVSAGWQAKVSWESLSEGVQHQLVMLFHQGYEDSKTVSGG